MTDIKLAPDANLQLDLSTSGSDIELDEGLATSVYISLFTDRRVQDGDYISPEIDSMGGWWGDTYSDVEGDYIGSKLWLLMREKITSQLLVRAKQYCEAALAWMVEDGVAQSITVTVTRSAVRADEVDIFVQIAQPDGNGASLRYAVNWAAMRG